MNQPSKENYERNVMKQLALKEGNMVIVGHFDKSFENEDYEVYFNTKTGVEVLKGKDGNDPFKTELPLLFDVGIMGSCLNKCYFCYQGRTTEPHMTLENFKLLIDQVKHHTNQVALGGRGDPNLHPQFKEIVEYAIDNGVVPNYTTSGNGLTDEHIEISKMCGAVAVSDYSQDFTYDAIKRLMDAGIKTNIHMIFSKPNYHTTMKILYGYNPWLSNSVEVVVKKGTNRPKVSKIDLTRLNAVIFLLFKPQGEGKDKLNLIPSPMQIEAFSNKVFDPDCKFKVGMDSCLTNHVMNYANPNKIQKMAVDTCEASRMSVYVSPSMQLIPCSFADHPEWGIQINGKKDIHYLWNRSMKFNSFRSRLKKNPSCCPVGF